MNGKGSSPRPVSISRDQLDKNLLEAIQNPKDLYRQAVVSPDFHEKYPGLTGNWAEDRHKWLNP